jgi:catechol 2,3-dioxygenase-like lactoylglutathione lyase family enzyme
MFDHVTIRVSDRDASRRFYGLGLETLGLELTHTAEHFDEWGDFGIAEASAEHPATRRLHVAFTAPDRERVGAFWRALTAAGYADDGSPGLRPQYRDDYYGAFVLDPDGNSVEAVHHAGIRPDRGGIDHLWLRARDIAASKRFYEAIAPVEGLELGHDAPDHVQFRAEGSSFSFVTDGLPTEQVHIAFPAPDRATVEAFHRVGVAAGHRSNGAPGERPQYHPGYYGAFLLDPDGNNVEAVFHERPGTVASAELRLP